MNATAKTARPLRVLVVEDTPDDALLLMRALRKGGFAPEHVRVDTPEALRAALAEGGWELVISDYTMPEFGGLQALAITRELAPELPFVIVSGNIGEDVAVGAMRAGAQDYLLKHNLTRLAPVVMRELEEAASRRARREAEDRLVSAQGRMNDILGSLGDIVWSVGLPSMEFIYVNAAAETIFGRPLAELIATPLDWLESVHPDDRERMTDYIGNTSQSGANSAEFRIVRPDGEVRWLLDRARLITDEKGCKLRIDGISSDITRHKESQAQLYRAAHHDALTGLPNRKLLLERLRQALARRRREGGTPALLLIDVDRFKTINDSLGHRAGDAMLCQLAGRLASCLREEDMAARLGGDEFAVLLPELDSEGGAEAVARKIMAALAPPMQLEGRTLHCTASLGIALAPRDGEDAESLMKNADTAMYAAKHAGRNTHRFYAEEMNAASARLLELENALRGALERGEFMLHYQPQIDLSRDGAVCGFEALLRWNHPQRGMVSPAEFIPLAEETGLIVPIGEWVLHEACRQAKQWVEAYDPALRMAVNLSARQFALPDLPQRVASALKQSGLPARNLELEVTESLVMQDIEQSARLLKELKAMGVSLAIDDFGTGYSSLAYLRRFPIDILKIDRSFVAEIARNPDDAAICSTIVAMAHMLRMKVVAEGIETEHQLGFLLQQHCDRAQGFHFSRPLPAATAGELLHKGLAVASPSARAEAGTRTLLLLDDEANILTSLKRLLRRDGYRILCANTPAEAFGMLAAEPVSVIISDQRMPEMAGTEFLRRVKDLYPDTVRIVLSGYTELQTVIEAINEGAIYRFLTKPWDDDQLRAAIREAFRQHELGRENARLNQQNIEHSARLQEMNERLQGLLGEKAGRIARDEALIGAAQEAFYHVPLPLLGIDDNGMVVLANGRALDLWPNALPGNTLDEALPADLAIRLLSDAAGAPFLMECADRSFQVQRQRIDSRSGGAGWLFSFLPLAHAAAISTAATGILTPTRIH